MFVLKISPPPGPGPRDNASRTPPYSERYPPTFVPFLLPPCKGLMASDGIDRSLAFHTLYIFTGRAQSTCLSRVESWMRGPWSVAAFDRAPRLAKDRGAAPAHAFLSCAGTLSSSVCPRGASLPATCLLCVGIPYVDVTGIPRSLLATDAREYCPRRKSAQVVGITIPA